MISDSSVLTAHPKAQKLKPKGYFGNYPLYLLLPHLENSHQTYEHYPFPPFILFSAQMSS